MAICSIEVPADGVVFQLHEMTTERIKEDADYEGVRIKVTALLGRIRKSLQFDIGFGDVVIPRPQLIEYPVLLNMASPQLQAYSKESIISEKFEAMITLSVMNSRMKDFYDIYTLLTTNDFEGHVLYGAVLETFHRRGTIVEKVHPLFQAEFAVDDSRTKQWIAFIRRLAMAEQLSFRDVMTGVVQFLEPVYQSILNDQEYIGQWKCDERRWIDKS